MKQMVEAAELKGNDLQQYIDNVRKEVERDLNPDVNSIDWDMDNNTVYLTVEFKNGVSESFPFEAWRFTGEPAYFDYDVDIIVDAVRNYMKSEEMEGYESLRYKFIKSKRVLDSDGFYTDYTMYYDTESDQYIFIFGDNDLYDPETSDWDWTCEGERQANEWFDGYNGFADDEDAWIDDVEECQDIMSDWNIEDQIDAPDTIGKLNPGDKFVNRNGVVVEIIEPDRLGHIQFKIGDEVKSGNEKSIQQMLYRNNYMRKIETSEDVNSGYSVGKSADYIYVIADSWEEFIREVEKETGLKLDSAYKRRHGGDDYFEFVDDLGNTFSATYNQYNDGSFEFRGESLKTL